MHSPIEGIIIVTGASSGIGAEFARQLASRAEVLVLVARREDRLEALAAELRAAHPNLGVAVSPCDLSESENARNLVAEVVTRFGRIDVLINNAGMGDIGPLATADPAKIDRMVGVNVLGFTAMARAVVPAMVARRRGAILNVSSGFGLLTMPMFSAYVATKHYVHGFTASLRAELARYDISVSELCPGPVATEFEAVAENPFGMSTPAAFEISAAHCARVALRGLRRNKALIIPGFAAWLMINIGRITPSPIYRLVNRLVAGQMYKKLDRPADAG